MYTSSFSRENRWTYHLFREHHDSNQARRFLSISCFPPMETDGNEMTNTDALEARKESNRFEMLREERSKESRVLNRKTTSTEERRLSSSIASFDVRSRDMQRPLRPVFLKKRRIVPISSSEMSDAMYCEGNVEKYLIAKGFHPHAKSRTENGKVTPHEEQNLSMRVYSSTY